MKTFQRNAIIWHEKTFYFINSEADDENSRISFCHKSVQLKCILVISGSLNNIAHLYLIYTPDPVCMCKVCCVEVCICVFIHSSDVREV